MNSNSLHIGKVILAGAGPGDPELLTLKTLRYLQQADVVIVDRLVSPEILTEYVRPSALIIPVGKQCNSQASTPQRVINQLLVTHALEGRLVVRLKGGDVSIFSNVLDELETLTRHDIPYELVPGVTAALGAAAYAGIPLTARGYSTAVRFLTGCRPGTDADWWQDLARTEDTLVLYMSSTPLDELVSRLVEAGIAADRWVAVIEQATTPMQRVSSWPVHEYLSAAAGSHYASPALVIVGRVAALHSSFQWLTNSRSKELYFPPVQQPVQSPKKIAVC
ncbi:uroporphyrinogen-III C-methyltransferase [Puia sp.]|jgi:uroporphyrin-III C-methyltransferase/precorrin-2 dehydrogenase/sirohydrochlorin ferrochelatase/uroporphyrin-III C-methyltransferase|uniref:uroporphyrinogen-III C-methyltransferase n=1 Tax=Puia sp. TaxID=2045100 RepID=UPI002F40970B